MHHRGLEELELHPGRSGNQLSLALVTLGLYIAGSLLMLHSAGPRDKLSQPGASWAQL